MKTWLLIIGIMGIVSVLAVIFHTELFGENATYGYCLVPHQVKTDSVRLRTNQQVNTSANKVVHGQEIQNLMKNKICPVSPRQFLNMVGLHLLKCLDMLLINCH